MQVAPQGAARTDRVVGRALRRPTGSRLPGCVTLLPDLLRDSGWLRDSAHVTRLFQKKKKKNFVMHQR